jgi:hypothetical protein
MQVASRLTPVRRAQTHAPGASLPAGSHRFQRWYDPMLHWLELNSEAGNWRFVTVTAQLGIAGDRHLL